MKIIPNFPIVLILLLATTAIGAEKPNVLFVIVDDLRPELGCYGNTHIKTPGFDRFASQSVRFSRAYCQAAACAPSRASVMTGLRPDTTRVWDLRGKFRVNMPDVVTMPQHFKKHGYHTVSMGKIFHNHMPDRVSFDEPDLRPKEYLTPEMIDRDPESFYYDEDLKKELAKVRERRLRRNPRAYAGGWAYGRSTESSDAPDDAFYDGAQTTLAIKTLKRLREREEPFFLALGYYRPHLPFVAPKKYWDLYDPEQLPLASNPFLPKNSPIMAMNSAYELKGCYDLEHVKHPSVSQVDEATARRLKHGYYASVSYVDACFDRLMKGLDELDLADDTIVVIWGDHGWKLGEHGSWCKQTNYDLDVRVPLMIRTPERHSAGARCDRLVELVDLYPTLCDLVGIEIPDRMEGASLKPLLSDPNHSWKAAAFSQFHRNPRVTPDKGRYMGYSMVTERHHLVEWRHWDHEAGQAGERAAVELYDLQVDPRENNNIADRRDAEPVVNRLLDKLKKDWPRKQRAAKSTEPFSIVSMTLHDQALAGAHDVELQGDLAFVPGKWRSLSIIDIANPKKPRIVWFKHDSEIPDSETVLPDGNTLFLGARDFLTLDISNPKKPEVLSKVSGQPRIDRINGMVCIGNHILAANKSGYIDAFDVSNVRNPKLFGAFETKKRFQVESPHDIDRFGDYAVVVDPRKFVPPFGKLTLFKVLEQGKILPLAKWKLVGHVEGRELIGANRVQVKGGFAYVGGSFSPPKNESSYQVQPHMTVVRLADPSRPRIIAELPFHDERGPNGLTIAGKVVFCAGGQTVAAYDISNPEKPRLVTDQSFPKYRAAKRTDNYHDLIYRDGYLYISAQSDNGFLILKVDDKRIRRLADAE